MEITEEFIKDIYTNEYIGQHLSGLKIAKKYDISAPAIYHWFQKLGLKARDDREKTLKYTCDSNYFEKIDREDKAYWLGFIYADGYITKRGDGGSPRLGIAISEKDKKHLEYFRYCIKTNAPINTYTQKGGYGNNTVYCRIIISDPKIVNDLIDKGCYYNKTNIVKFPTREQVPEDMIKHFIRGYFDGDGSIYENKTGFGFSFCGTDDLLNGIIDELIKNGITDRRAKLEKRKPGQIVSSFSYGGNQITARFGEYLYSDDDFIIMSFLDRKADRYIKNLKRIAEIDKKRDRSNYSCCVCGDSDTNTVFYKCGKEGEWNQKILCARHYQQVMKNGKITLIKPRSFGKKNFCDVCGDEYGRMTLVGDKYPSFKGMTLCRRHYCQLYTYGELKDSIKGEHKNETNN